MMGIYKITNLVNQKVYVGQAVNIKKRWKDHRNDLKANRHCNNHLQSAWNKYGEENFKFEIIEECEEEKLTEREQYWIDYYGGINCNDNYNYKEAGIAGHLSDELKQKLSESRKGQNIGRVASKETRLKISKALKGRVVSEETKRKLSLANLGKTSPTKGRPSPLKGIHFSEERKQQMSIVRKGIKFTEEHKQKLKDAWKIRRLNGFSDKTRQKMSLSHKGMTPWNKGLKGEYAASLETRKKLSEDTSKRRWIHNDIEDRYIYYYELDKYLNNGYILGRKDASKNKGRITVNNGKITKIIYPNELEDYIRQGFVKGAYIPEDKLQERKEARQNRIWINNGIINKWINKNELEDYQQKGFKLGRIKRKENNNE